MTFYKSRYSPQGDLYYFDALAPDGTELIQSEFDGEPDEEDHILIKFETEKSERG